LWNTSINWTTRSFGHSREEIGNLINELVIHDFAFWFEESLQEEASYPFAKSHKKVHELLPCAYPNIRPGFEKGEDVCQGLNSLLVTWCSIISSATMRTMSNR